MNIQITQQNLHKALSIMSRVASSKTELPILANVLVTATTSGVEFAATNLEIAVVHKASAKVAHDGQVAIPARLFYEFVSQLPKDKTVDLVLEKNKLRVSAGGYSSHIQGTNVDDFPALPEISSSNRFEVNNTTLQATITKTILATSHDETRPILGGVYVHTYKKTLYFTATDGYRLAEAQVSGADIEADCVVPAQALQEALKMSQDAETDTSELFFDDGQFAIQSGDTQLVSRLIEGSYPEYRKLIPENSDVHLTIAKDELQTAAKLAGLFARESGGSITITTSSEDQTVTIASVASQVGENSSVIKSKVSSDGSVVLNVRYLNDALGCFDDKEVSLRFAGSIAPCVLTAEKDTSYQHIVMPLKS